MRTDVKVGVVLSLIVVVGAGWYFLRPGSQEEAVPLDARVASGDTEADAQPPPAVIRRKPPRQASAKRRTSPRPKDDTTADSAAGRPEPTDEAGPKPPATSDTVAHAGSTDEPTPTGDPLADLVRRGRDTGGTTDLAEGRPAADQPKPTETPSQLMAETASADAPDSARRSRRSGRLARSAGAGQGRGEGQPSARRRPATEDDATATLTAAVRPSVVTGPERATRSHTVQRGDTFSILAEIYYGSQRHTGFLMEANPQVTDPNRLLVGTVIKVPPLGERTQPAAAAAREGTYRVRQGDTFYGIARDVLGDSSRWKELLELNSALVNGDPKNLRVGQVLELPGGANARRP